MLKRIVSGIVGVTAIAASAFAADGTLKSRLDPVIDRAIKDERIVGAVVLVARDGKLIYKKAAGLADREARRPVTLNTQFRLASLSKPIVAAATLALSDAEVFRLDDPVTKWYPEFKPKLADGREPDVTIYQLLSHTAGLGYGFLEAADGPYHKAGVSDGFDRAVPTLDENLRRLATAPLLYEPGTGWSYSIGYELLGGVLEKAGKGKLQAIVQRTVTKPLGLKATTFAPATSKQVAAQYAFAIPRPKRLTDSDSVDVGKSPLAVAPGRVFDRKVYTSAGTGLVGTAEDYLKFLEALRKGGEPILDRAAVYSFTTNSLGLITSPDLGKGWVYGYGVSVLKNQALAESQHTNGTWKLNGEYGSHFWVDPENGLTVVVLTNTAGAGTQERFGDDITRAVYGPEWKLPLPTIGDIPSATVVEGKAYKFIPEASNAVSFSVANKPAWASFDPKNGALTGSPKTGDIGSYKDIVIAAVNSSGSTPLPSFEITVAAAPPPKPAEPAAAPAAVPATPVAAK